MPGRRRDRFSFVVGVYDRPVARTVRFPFIRVHPPEVGRPPCVGETKKEREGARSPVQKWEDRECINKLIPATTRQGPWAQRVKLAFGSRYYKRVKIVSIYIYSIHVTV